MKKIFIILLVVFSQVSLKGQTPICAEFRNFNATCIKGSSLRKFNLSFNVTTGYLFATGSGNLKLTTATGTLNGNAVSSGLNFPQSNGIAGATVNNCVYEETLPNGTPSTLYFLAVITDNATGKILCQTKITVQLPECSNCTLNYLTINETQVNIVQVGYPPTPSNTNYLLNVPFTAGPNKITKFTMILGRTERRSICPGISPSPTYTPVADSSIKVIDGMIQEKPSFIFLCTGKQLAGPPVGLSYIGNTNSSLDLKTNKWTELNFKLPTKLSNAPGCIDEYRGTVVISYTDEFGCTKQLSKQVAFKTN